MATRKRYLGEGAYVDVDDRGVVLTTENGIETTNTIVLDMDALIALVRWAEDWSLLRLEASRD